MKEKERIKYRENYDFIMGQILCFMKKKFLRMRKGIPGQSN